MNQPNSDIVSLFFHPLLCSYGHDHMDFGYNYHLYNLIIPPITIAFESPPCPISEVLATGNVFGICSFSRSNTLRVAPDFSYAVNVPSMIPATGISRGTCGRAHGRRPGPEGLSRRRPLSLSSCRSRAARTTAHPRRSTIRRTGKRIPNSRTCGTSRSTTTGGGTCWTS